MKKLTRAERLQKFEEDIDAWREGKLELVTRRFELHDPPDYAAEEIKRIRDDLNMSQAEFGRLIGVSKRTVESWEHGHRTPDGAAAWTIEMYSKPPWRDHVRLPAPPAAGRPKTSRMETSAPIRRPPRTQEPAGTTGDETAPRKARTVAAAAPKPRKGVRPPRKA